MSCVIQFPDGKRRTFPSPQDGAAAAEAAGFLKEALGLKIKGRAGPQDIRSVLKDGDEAELLTARTRESLPIIRHSAAHVLAQAVQSLFADVKVTVGPVIEDGFYYDFDTERKFTPEDLTRIEKQMKKILKQNHKVTRETWPVPSALQYFKEKGEVLKQEIIKDLAQKEGLREVGVYKQGPWLDLCKGPHVLQLGQIGAIKILSHSGAYWRGDSRKKQLQRIYGTAFHTQQDLEGFLQKREEAAENDHRLIGKRLDLFWFSERAPGQPFFTAKGAAVYHALQNFLRKEYRKNGYEEIITPQMYSSDLFERSGHLRHFAENMFAALEADSLDSTKAPPKNLEGVSHELRGRAQTRFFLKPMNCPGHCLLYKKDRKSYKDLPWRAADFGRLHRNESGGSLHGLTRVRGFCQDDAHIFCRPDQLMEEIQNGMKMLMHIYKTLGLTEYNVSLSGRPENRMGREELWDQAEEALAGALRALNIPWTEEPGEGAFYGPKLDISVQDSFSRRWQLGTFQCDFNLPEAFDLAFVNRKDQTERPVMIHRAVLGSLERFIGLYLEHRKGRLPFWLCPLQAVVLPIGESDRDFAGQIEKRLASAGILCKMDGRSEKLSYKIRQAQLLQIPYMIIVGKREAQTGSLSVRSREGGIFQRSLADLTQGFSAEKESRALQSVFSSQKPSTQKAMKPVAGTRPRRVRGQAQNKPGASVRQGLAHKQAGADRILAERPVADRLAEARPAASRPQSPPGGGGELTKPKKRQEGGGH